MTREDGAMEHLGAVLNFLSDLVDDDRCRAVEEAFAFYNKRNPDSRIDRSGIWESHLVSVHPVMGIGCQHREWLTSALKIVDITEAA